MLACLGSPVSAQQPVDDSHVILTDSSIILLVLGDPKKTKKQSDLATMNSVKILLAVGHPGNYKKIQGCMWYSKKRNE